MNQLEMFPAAYRETTKAGKKRAVMEWQQRQFVFEYMGGDMYGNPYEDLGKGRKRIMLHWDIRDELGLYINCAVGIRFLDLERAIHGLSYEKYHCDKERHEIVNDSFNIDHIFGDRPFQATHYLVGTTEKRPVEIVVLDDEWYYRNPQGIGRKFVNKFVPMSKFTEPLEK